MILHPVNYFRDFTHDLSHKSLKDLKQKVCKITLAALPLFATIRPLQTPLSVGFDCIRTITNISNLILCIKAKGHISEKLYLCFQICISVAAVALTILQPVYGLIASSISDMVANGRECIEHLQHGRHKEASVAFARFILSSLIISAICYGAIEITVAALTLQIILGCIESLEHFKKREFIEGVLNAVTVGMHIKQIIPQAKLLHWKYSQEAVMTATLKQDSRGFVYLDIPDEYVKNLYELYRESDSSLPPYFGTGKAGAHVSVIGSGEMRPDIKIGEIGQTFQFRISNVDAVKPANFKGVDKVWFLTLSAPDLLTLRETYGFSPRISGDHDFHLTFALHYNAA